MKKPIAKILNLIMVILGMTILIISCNNSPGHENTDSLNVDEFNNPPIDARPGALWPWLNGYVDTARMTYELEQMKEKGMRGPVLWDIGSLRDPLKMIPAGPAFMGDTSLMYIHHAMDVCRRLGLQLSVFASSSWNAGGSWIGPENASKEICSSKIIIEGPAVFHSSLPLPEDARTLHSDVKIFAIPDKKSNKAVAQSEIIDLTAKMKNDILTWEVPPGTWIILRFVERNTGQDLECPSPNSHGLILDHLSAEAAATHINYMMDRIQDGRPNLEPIKTFMLDSYEVWPADDWTPGFAEEFKLEFDYDPLPWLPALTGVVIDNQDLTNRFLHDYHKMVSDLLIKNHFSTIKKLLNDRGVGLLSEAGHGGYARVEPLKALGASDIPMGEFWNGSRFWVVKEAASAAHIYGKKIVSSETLTGWRSWKDGPMHYKRLFDVALCAGLNQVTFHTFAHNPALAGLPGFVYHAGEHFNVNNTWWKYAGPMLSYMSRCSYLLQKGQFVADLCLYYGDQAPNRVPSRRIDPTLTPLYDSTKCLHCGQDKTVETPGLGHGHDYDYINEEIILSKLDIQKKKLVIPGGPGYALLVLPDSQAISPDVLNKLESLVSKGAVVYGPKPTQSNSLQDYPECDSM
ncbi:MAG: hypothetical protein J7L89_00985 [Bacteroidales bacterium]|nr:hypothetical protein [Bacteroidales bacterium]